MWGAAGADQQTADISAIIQEIVSRGGWKADNALSLIITGTGARTAEADHGTSAAPLLHVEWQPAGGGPPTPNAIAGTGSADRLVGTAAADAISGLAGADHLLGKGGNDVLMVAAGDFVFDTRLNSATNVDRITDFAVGADRIQLENDVRRRASRRRQPEGLGASHFFVGGAAHDADDFVLYNRATGALSYDADGSDRAPR